MKNDNNKKNISHTRNIKVECYVMYVFMYKHESILTVINGFVIKIWQNTKNKKVI